MHCRCRAYCYKDGDRAEIPFGNATIVFYRIFELAFREPKCGLFTKRFRKLVNEARPKPRFTRTLKTSLTC